MAASDGPNSDNYAYGQKYRWGSANADISAQQNDATYASNRAGPQANWGQFGQQQQQANQDWQNAGADRGLALADRGTALQDRGNQQSTFTALGNFMNAGPGPDMAGASMQAGLQSSQQGAQNLLANAGPNAGGMGLAQALQANQQGAGYAAQQGALGRMQQQRDWQGQQLNALGQMGGLAGAMRGQDYQGQGLSLQGQSNDYSGMGANAGLMGQDVSQQGLNAQSYLQNQAQGDARYQNDQQNAQNISNAELQARMNYGNAQVGVNQSNAQLQQQSADSNKALAGNVFNTVGGGAAKVATGG